MNILKFYDIKMDRSDKLRLELIDLYSDLDLSSLLENIAQKIKKHLNCEEASIILYNEERQELYFKIATGEKEEELKKITIKKGEGVAGWIAEHEESIIINNCPEDDRFSQKIDIETEFITKSIAGAPVLSESRLIGVVEAINKIDGEFNEEDLEILKVFSGFINIPLENAILYRKISRDSEEKTNLIELGKSVSSSFDYTEVFENLKKIITDHIKVKEINIMVNSTGKLYRLCEDSGDRKKDEVSLTRIGKNSALFPLRTEDKVIGFMEIKSDFPIPESFVSLFRGLSIYTAISINKYEMYCELIEKERLEKELQIARDIQQSFLLKEKIEITGIDYDFINLPSSSVGGDYYDIIPLKSGKIIFTINDIAGHGIPASLLMSVFRTNFVHSIKNDTDISRVFLSLNDLIAETTEANLYLTSFTVSLDIERMSLDYLNCGHSTQFIIRGNKSIDLSDGTTVLGMFPGIETTTSTVKLQKGDIITMYTDGVAEEENEQGIQYSVERLKNLIIKKKRLAISDIKESILIDLKQYSGGKSFNDDITFILIRIN